MTMPAHAPRCWRAPVRRRTDRQRGERMTPSTSTAKKAVEGFKSMNQTPDQRCKFDEWLLNNSLNLHLEYLKITGDITDGSDPFFHFIHLPVNGLQDPIHLR